MAEKKTKALAVDVLTLTGEKSGTVKLNPEVFAIEPHQQAMIDAVKVYQANMRQATAKTKKRDEVSGGGKKPWRQKGTGRARAGSTRSPIWVGGGIAFGPTGNQNYKLSQNKSEHRLALRSALSLKVANKQFIVIDEFKFDAMKTKAALTALVAIKAEGKTLIVVPELELNTYASVRNLNKVILVDQTNVSVYDLLNSDVVIMAKPVIAYLEEVLQ
jgi:large subunit ribosomal protein L4